MPIFAGSLVGCEKPNPSAEPASVDAGGAVSSEGAHSSDISTPAGDTAGPLSTDHGTGTDSAVDPVSRKESAAGTESKALMEQPAPPRPTEWIAFSKGRFKMGGGDYHCQRPAHRVWMPPFEMSASEVTVQQYRACVASGKCTPPVSAAEDKRCNYGDASKGDFPVNCVSWYQARAYCAYLNGRLPSEAEWEYAARSGGKEVLYPWGNETADGARAVMKGASQNGGAVETARSVCSKPDGNSIQGLCDLSGNVAEWVEDKYHKNYRGAPADGSAWIRGKNGHRVMRGGSFKDEKTAYVEARYRDEAPMYGGEEIGFRCVRSDTRTNEVSDTDGPASSCETAVEIKDETLRRTAFEALGKPDGPLLPSDIPKLRRLKSTRNGEPIDTLEGLECFTALEELHLSDCRFDKLDLYPIHSLKSLKRLVIHRCDIDDLSPVVYLRHLEHLEVVHSLSFEDKYNGALQLAALQRLTRLNFLSLRGNDITSLPDLSQLKRLRHLDVSLNDMKAFPSVSLPALETLNLAANRLSDAAFLNGLPNLKTVQLSRNKLTRIDAAKSLSRLRRLALRDNQLKDVSALSSLKKLEMLDVSANALSSIPDLSTWPNLIALDISENRLEQIRASSRLVAMRIFSAANNRLSDASWLSFMPRLKQRNLVGNPIADPGKLDKKSNKSKTSSAPPVVKSADGAEPKNSLKPERPIAEALIDRCEEISRNTEAVLQQLSEQNGCVKEGNVTREKDFPVMGKCYMGVKGAWAFEMTETVQSGFRWKLLYLPVGGEEVAVRPVTEPSLETWEITPEIEKDDSFWYDRTRFSICTTEESTLQYGGLFDFDGHGEEELILTMGLSWAHESDVEPMVFIWTYGEGGIRPFAPALKKTIDAVEDLTGDGVPDMLVQNRFWADETSCGKNLAEGILSYNGFSSVDERGYFSERGRGAADYWRGICPERPQTLVFYNDAIDENDLPKWIDSRRTGEALLCARLWGESSAQLERRLLEHCIHFVERDGCNSPLGYLECPRWLWEWIDEDTADSFIRNDLPLTLSSAN